MAPTTWTTKVTEALEKRGVRPECPRCGANKWQVGEGFVSFSVTNHPRAVLNLDEGGKVIPTIPVVCDPCGYVALHTAGGLGLKWDAP